jgi:hypothetical protein
MFSLNCVLGSLSVSGNGACVRCLCIVSNFDPPCRGMIFDATIKNSKNIFQCMKLEELMVGEGSKLAGTGSKLAGTNFTIGKINEIPMKILELKKVQNCNNCKIPRNSDQISQPRKSGPVLDISCI